MQPDTTTAPSKPHPLVAPFDTSKWGKEKDVKTHIKRLLDFHGWFHWMPAANGFGAQGVADHLALKSGVFLAIEAKFGSNRPTPVQKAWAAQVLANDAYAFCVNERNIDHLAYFLESFEVSTQCHMHGQPIPDEHGSRLLNAISALTDAYAGERPAKPQGILAQ